MIRGAWCPWEGVRRWLLVFAFLLVPAQGVCQSDAPLAQVESAEPSAGNPPEPSAGNPPQGSGAGNDILGLDIEQLAKTPVVVPSSPSSLMDMPVTSLTREPSTVGHSAAAVFVITPEMIRRTGATCIPEALRMVPGMEVARMGSSTWSVTCRGFSSGMYANKLLVLVDGRTVYTPVNGGVNWDTVDVLLEDIERIEVIRGPGGTLWGANAVNGVISIITKSAKDTQGAYLTAGGGTQEQMLDGFRYGGQIGQDGYYRIWGKHFERGPFPVSKNAPPGGPGDGSADDAWRQGRFGFRTDWNPAGDKSNNFTVQGDYYRGDARYSVQSPQPMSEQLVSRKNPLEGENVLTRWRHVIDDDTDWALQMYYDKYLRRVQTTHESVRTLDIDYQYHLRPTDRQSITWGAGYRNISDNLVSDEYAIWDFVPAARTTYLVSQFAQDEITLVEDVLTFTLGTKLEENSYTGFEVQPSARLLWMLNPKSSAWAAITRAVRMPTRVDEDLVFRLEGAGGDSLDGVAGNKGFRSEELIAYELGYRSQVTERFSWDIATFYNVYEKLRTVKRGETFWDTDSDQWVTTTVYANGGAADGYGVELSGNWSITERWRLYGQYSLLRICWRHGESEAQEGNGTDPRNQVYLRSSWDLGHNLEFDLMARYVDRLTSIDVPSYISMDLRLGWRPRKGLELAVVGQNLLQNSHQEYTAMGGLSGEIVEVPRGVYGTVTWRH